jgi:ribosomal-protein-alanine N-acetyltransferase
MEFIFDNFILRLPINDDADRLLAISNDDETMKYYGNSGSYYKSRDEAIKELEWFTDQFKKNGGRWVIAEKSSNLYIGDIGLFNFVQGHNRIEIGFKLMKDFWNKGIITKSIQVLLKYFFENSSINRIEALVDKRNVGSKTVLFKNGFVFEGTFREYEFCNNAYVDLEMYSILKNDFKT